MITKTNRAPGLRPREDRDTTRRATLPADGCVTMAQLAHQFPALAGAPGAAPWDTQTFLRWLCGPGPTAGGLLAGCFLLAVWNGLADWEAEARALGLVVPYGGLRFDALAARAAWDDAHRAAFEAWWRAPVWP